MTACSAPGPVERVRRGRDGLVVECGGVVHESPVAVEVGAPRSWFAGRVPGRDHEERLPDDIRSRKAQEREQPAGADAPQHVVVFVAGVHDELLEVRVEVARCDPVIPSWPRRRESYGPGLLRRAPCRLTRLPVGHVRRRAADEPPAVAGALDPSTPICEADTKRLEHRGDSPAQSGRAVARQGRSAPHFGSVLSPKARTARAKSSLPNTRATTSLSSTTNCCRARRVSSLAAHIVSGA